MDIFNALQLLGGIVLLLGYPAQVLRLILTRDAESFSLTWLGCTNLGILLMEVYAVSVRTQAFMFLVTNTLALLAAGLMFALVLWFKVRRTR